MVVDRQNSNRTGFVTHVSSSAFLEATARLEAGVLAYAMRGGNRQLDLSAGIELAPDGQLPAHEFGAFVHARQAVVSGPAAFIQTTCGSMPLPSSRTRNPKLPLVVTDVHFDPPRAWRAGMHCAALRAAIRYTSSRTIGSRSLGFAFHLHAKLRTLPVGLLAGKFFSERADRAGKVVR